MDSRAGRQGAAGVRSRGFWVGFCASFVLIAAVLLPAVLFLNPPWLHGHNEAVVTQSTGVVLPGRRPDVCVKPAYPLKGERSSWHYMKVIPHPAECTVQGFTIEALEPEYNFRRPYTLGYVGRNPEDKTHVLAYFRAVQDVTMRARARRVFLDLGGRTFDSSVQWFLQWYPLDFTEVHVFEALPGMFQLPNKTGFRHPDLLGSLDLSSRVHRWGLLPIPDWALDDIHVYEAYVTIRDEPAPPGGVPMVNITRFILEELKLTPDDAVVVKMDIEMAEWDVLPAWMEIPMMPLVIDEIFVEAHYNHTTMTKFHWTKGPPREACVRLLQDMRNKGFFIHPWP